MPYNFGLDLRVARRKSGLTQKDCAHLLGDSEPRISKLESGAVLPTSRELAILCFIFETETARLNLGIIASESDALNILLGTMPDCPQNWPSRRDRLKTLNGAAERLLALDPEDD